MTRVAQIVKISVATILIGICAVKLWQASSIYLCEPVGAMFALSAAAESITPVAAESAPPAAAESTPSPSQRTGDSTHIVPNSLPAPTYEPVINRFITDLQDEINEDIIGWLTIPGTKIDYPIVSTDDNEYYLHRDIYKNPSQAGSLFADCRGASEFTGINTVVYGHNMKNRSMFGDLRSYADPDFLAENGFGVLYTSTKTYLLEIFAYMVVSSSNPEVYANPPSAGAFHEYIKENARIYYEPENLEKVLALSTCSYEYEDARIIVLASMTKQ